MQRVRQFGQLRESRRSQRSNFSNTKQHHTDTFKANLICVNCVNKSLSKQKQLKKTLQNQNQAVSARNELEQTKFVNPTVLGARKKKVEEEYRLMTQYNTHIARQHSQQKEVERTKKLEQKKQHEIERQKLLKESQNRAKREKLLKEKWFSDLKQQMAAKQGRKQREIQEKLAGSAEKENLFRDLVKSRANRLSVNYRQELKQQIKANELKKEAIKEQERKKKDISANYLLDWAEQRQNKLKQQQEYKKKLLLEQARERQRQTSKKREEKEQENRKVREQIERKLRDDEERRLLITRMKQNRMNEYVREVRQQIDQREIAKIKEKEARLSKFQETFHSRQQKSKEREACNSCDKQYPKNYLSSFQSIF